MPSSPSTRLEGSWSNRGALKCPSQGQAYLQREHDRSYFWILFFFMPSFLFHFKRGWPLSEESRPSLRREEDVTRSQRFYAARFFQNPFSGGWQVSFAFGWTSNGEYLGAMLEGWRYLNASLTIFNRKILLNITTLILFFSTNVICRFETRRSASTSFLLLMARDLHKRWGESWNTEESSRGRYWEIFWKSVAYKAKQISSLQVVIRGFCFTCM